MRIFIKPLQQHSETVVDGVRSRRKEERLGSAGNAGDVGDVLVELEAGIAQSGSGTSLTLPLQITPHPIPVRQTGRSRIVPAHRANFTRQSATALLCIYR